MLMITIQSIAPVFLLILLGIALRVKGHLNDSENAALSNLVYRVGLPALIFTKVASSDLRTLWNPIETGYVMGSIVLLFSVLWFISRYFIKDSRVLGAFVQGSYRGNCAIVGFAVILNRYGESGLAYAVFLLAFIMPVYNILAVLLLSRTQHAAQLSLTALMKSLLTNPLIVSLIIATPFALFSVPVPSIFLTTLQSLSKMVLPLALIAIGAELRLNISKKYLKIILVSSLIKLLIFPLLQLAGGLLLHFEKQTLGVMTLLFASPTAVSSYVMAKAMGADEKLTAQIIVVSTTLGIITMAVFVYWGQL